MTLSCKTSITLLLLAASNIFHASEALLYVKFVAKYATMYTNITELTLPSANHPSTKIQCGGACLPLAGCDGYIFDTLAKECVFCSVQALAKTNNDIQVSMKIYVKEDLVEYLETDNSMTGSSK